MHDLIRRSAARPRALERLLDYYQYSAARADALLAAESRTASLFGPVPVAVPALADREQALAWARAERANLLACLDHATGTGQY